jgi:hypothetical protein
MQAHRILAVYLRTFLTSALDGNGQYATYLGRFNLWERAHGTRWINGLGGPQSWPERFEEDTDLALLFVEPEG